MRFITEFELHPNTMTRVIDSFKANGKFKLGIAIAEAFGWEERGGTTIEPDTPIIHKHKLEIEAFPMDKWVEFKQKLFTHVYEEGRRGVVFNQVRVLELIKELESFSTPVTNPL